MEKIFGIDLGTTYSCIAHVDEYGKPVIIKNSEGASITPSVVFFDDNGEVIVGQVAKEMLKTDPQNIASFVKRSMGDSNFRFTHLDKQYSPEEISSRILQKLVKDASAEIGYEIKNVVITCPAYFGENERKATEVAGELAGLNVKSIINEPTAAALTYGIDKVQDQKVMVYDLGGGTFDVTIIQIKPDRIEVIATEGNHNLGGKDWDNSIMGYFAERFKEETRIEDDIFHDIETYGDLQLKSENVKKVLSQKEKAKESIIYGTDKAIIEITREKFNEITKDHAEQTISITKLTIENAGNKGVKGFDKILLVGGSTRMPQIREILEHHFPNIPIESFDPDESVAKGAAIYGQQLAVNGELVKRFSKKFGVSEEDIKLDKVSEKELKEVEQAVADETGLTIGAVQKARTKIENITSKSFGILAFVDDTIQKVVNLVLSQSTLPVETTKTFSTHEANQENVEITVFENQLFEEHVELSMSKEIGKGVIEGLPSNLPAGSPIQVTFKINTQGRLDIHAIETTGNRELNFSIERISGISGRELEEAKERSKAVKLS